MTIKVWANLNSPHLLYILFTITVLSITANSSKINAGQTNDTVELDVQNVYISNNSIFDDLTEEMNLFSSLTGPDFHSLDALKNIVSVNQEYVQKFKVIGSLVSNSMSKGVKENTTEYEAMKHLNGLLENAFNKTKNYFNFLKKQLPLSMTESNYDEEITKGLRDMEMRLFYLNPIFNQTKERIYFLHVCKSDKLEINYFPIRLRHYEYFREITKKQVKVYVEMYHIFYLIETHPNFKTNILTNFHNYLYFYQQQSFVNYFRSEYHTDKWKQHKPTLMSMIGSTWIQVKAKFYEMVPNLEEITSFDYLPYSTVGHMDFHRETMLNLASMFRSDIIRAEFFYALCKYVDYNEPESESSLNYWVEKVMKGDIEKALNTLPNFIDQMLTISWPEVTKLYATKAIDFKQINESSYDETAENIRQQISKTGLEKYGYQVLVLPSWKRDKYWAVNDDNQMIVFENYYNANIIISRYEKDISLEDLLSAKTWFDEKKPLIENILNNHKTYDDLTQIFQEISHGIEFSSNSSVFKHFVLAYNYELFSSKCQIPFGMSNNEIEIVKMGKELDHFDHSWSIKNYCYKVFFIM